ncbi:MAG: pentapeptide repeat-containing protein [Candidatus Treponema excrementipullorum]|nr:pentapeptide repeat-containing protein [Spirochaetia bacterium]MDD7012411.1 pentapeptide repeat-containing protein [Candidatus Treponema excrementipullorum]MDY4707148.1 pentapeptide repeat-containing protein [Candidatus Treponema excrementipullorum]
MFFAGLSNTEIVYESLNKNLQEGQVTGCVLDGLIFENKVWKESSFNNTNANNVAFVGFIFDAVTFYRSSLMKSCFNSCKIVNTGFSFDTLISTKWNNCNMYATHISQSTMQNVKMEKCRFDGCGFKDFEAIESSVKNCIFNNCSFEITGELGMNGFSGARIENTIFVNCKFTGNPLRGTHTISCVFANCFGEITDDAECKDTYGLGRFSGMLTETKLICREKAYQFIRGWV